MKPLFKNFVGRAFICTTWTSAEYAIITSVARGRVNYTRMDINDSEVQVPMSTTTVALRNLWNAGVVRFSPIPAVSK